MSAPSDGNGSGSERAQGAGSIVGALVKNPFVWAFLAGLVLLTLMWPLIAPGPPPPETLGDVPAFTLTDQQGETITKDDMLGRTWIASFFFTSCVSVCPMMISSLQRFDDVTREYGYEDVRIVSFTVDPETDTPEVLARYGADRGIDPERWKLVTGPRADLEALAVKGFMTAIGEKEVTDAGMMDIAHSVRFALVDPRGRIRGWFSADNEGLEEMLRQARHVRRGR